MADTIHKKKKNWPHFDKLHLGSKEYAEGWERIFGSKNETKGSKGKGRRKAAGKKHKNGWIRQDSEESREEIRLKSRRKKSSRRSLLEDGG